jgi:hypothetical protein
MVSQLHSRDFAGIPTGVRRLVIVSVALVQIVPISLGALVFHLTLNGAWSRGSPVAGRVLLATLLICSGFGTLIATYRDLRYKQPFQRSRLFLFCMGMIPVAVTLAVVFRSA